MGAADDVNRLLATPICSPRTWATTLGESPLMFLSLLIEAGSTVALVGASGYAKSSIIRTLMKYYDPFPDPSRDGDAGLILVDGVDLRSLDLELWRAKVGLVSQEPTLFDITIAENSWFGMLPLGNGAEPIDMAVLCTVSLLTTSLYYFQTQESLNARAQSNQNRIVWGRWGAPDAEFNWCEADYLGLAAWSVTTGAVHD